MHMPQAWAAMAATLILGATGTAKSGRRQVIPFSTAERWKVRITTKERGPAFMRRPHFSLRPFRARGKTASCHEAHGAPLIGPRSWSEGALFDHVTARPPLVTHTGQIGALRGPEKQN
jgi:hypothetical protein